MGSLYEHIMRARQAQIENDQRHDVQLAIIPFHVPEHPPTHNAEAQWASVEEIDAERERESQSYWDRMWENIDPEDFRARG